MTPIVNGLAQDYKTKIAFIKLNANTDTDGKVAFEYYRLLGHPSYILLKQDGTQVWRYVGLRTHEELVQQLGALVS